MKDLGVSKLLSGALKKILICDDSWCLYRRQIHSLILASLAMERCKTCLVVCRNEETGLGILERYIEVSLIDPPSNFLSELEQVGWEQ